MPRTQPSLYLHEQIMLLALRDEKGTVAQGSMYGYAMGGAILAELMLSGRIEVDDGKKKMVNLVSSARTGNEIIDECIAKLEAAKRRAGPQTWVARFASLKKLHHRVAEGLCDQGILRADSDKILLIFSRTIYPEINPQPERKLIDQMRKAIWGESPRVDPRIAILVSLANATGLLRITFDKKELKSRKNRIEQLSEGDLVGKATSDAIQEVQTAIMAAAIIPAITVTTISS